MIKSINMLRKLLRRSDKIRLVAIALLTAVSALWEVAGIGLVIPVVATVVNPDLLEQNIYLKIFYDLSPVKDHRNFMAFTAALVVLNFAAKNLFSLLVVHLQCKLIYNKQFELGDRLFRKFMDSEYSFMVEHSPAELNARINRVSLICDGTLMPMLNILSDTLAIAALTAVLLFFMPLVLTGALIALMVLALAFYLPFCKVNTVLSGEYMQYDNAVNADRVAAFYGIKTIKSSSCEEFLSNRFSRNYSRFTRVSGKIFLLGQFPRLGLEFLTVFLAMGIFGSMVLTGVASGTIVLNFALLTAAMIRILPSLSRLHYNLVRLRQVDKLFEGLVNDLCSEPESKQKTVAAQTASLENALEIKDLDFSYPDGKNIFRKFNCRIPAHTSAAIIGATGSGKTTLADLIVGLYRPQGGSITFDGTDLQHDPAAVRAITGYVPQYVFLLDGSIKENIAFGVEPTQIDMAKLERVIELSNLKSYVDSLPEKYDTSVGENGVKLSGGQRQRIGIARALYREPQLLILDEATSALDCVTENAVVEALETLHGSMTMLVIAHRQSTIEHCEQIINIGR
ncbi:MAG: ABC transporter ATP-binding protein [Lentisphaeria bacterium]|nr:ABC transporter ATP-binding protein [Lentisphaeria bacterium]